MMQSVGWTSASDYWITTVVFTAENGCRFGLMKSESRRESNSAGSGI